jgi:O-antigen/teichoic acid export membrane protein
MNLKVISRIKGTIIFRGGIAAIDQGLLSAINLGVQIFLINMVTKNEYGNYSLAFSIIMYLMSFQNAVVNTPITVTIAAKTEEIKARYISSIFSGQLIVLSILLVLGVLTATILYSLGLGSEESLLIASLSIASFGILNREFLRAYFFAEEEPARVLKLDLYYGIMYLSLIACSYFLFGVSVPLIIIFMGFAAGFDSLILNKRFKIDFTKKLIKESYAENWQMSKWSLLSVTLTHLQNYAYLYVIGILLGSSAMAEVSASRLLLMPLALITVGWGNVVRPYGSKLREQNQLRKFFKNLVLAGAIFPLIILIVTAILYLNSNWLLKFVFTKDYESVFQYLIYWALLSSAEFLRLNANYGLQVIKKFKSIAKVNASAAVFVLLLTILLTSEYQIIGALIASLIGQIFFIIVLWYQLYIAIFKSKTNLNDI